MNCYPLDGDSLECASIGLSDRLLACERLPAADRDIDVERIDFDREADPADGLGGNEGGAAAEEWLVDGIAGFTQFLVRALHSDPKRVEALIIDLLPRARQETDAKGDRIVEGIGNLVACLWLRYGLVQSRELLSSWMTDLSTHALELNRAAATLRDIVIAGYDTGKEDDARLRRNAQRLVRELVEASAASTQRYMAIDAASRTDADNSEVQAAVRLLDNVGNQLYFSSGAFRADEHEKPSGLVTLECRKAFLDDTADILRRIGDVGSPHTIYYLVDLLALLRTVDPARVFDLVAHALLEAGRLHGFQFESLGADRFVDVVGVFLADDREIFNDQDRRQKLIACLDAFAEAGWPKARRLLYRLPELLGDRHGKTFPTKTRLSASSRTRKFASRVAKMDWRFGGCGRVSPIPRKRQAAEIVFRLSERDSNSRYCRPAFLLVF